MRQFGLLTVICAVSCLFFAGEAVGSESPVESEDLKTSTIVKQTLMAGGATTVAAGSGLWMTSYHGETGRGLFMTSAIIYGPLVVFGAMILAVSPALGPNLFNRTRPRAEMPTAWRYPLLGSIVGAGIGAAGSYTIHNSAVSESSWLDWQSNRRRTAYVVGLPLAFGMTLGTMLGYIYQQDSRKFEPPPEEMSAARPSVVPVVGAPHHSEDDGWTVGAALRF